MGDRAAGRLDALGPLLSGATGVINLEGPVSPEPSTGEGVRLHNDPAALGALHDAGVRVVGIANNHAMDAGEGAPSTAAALREAGLVPAGLDAAEAVVVVRGKKVAVTAHDLARGAPPTLRDDLARAASKADVLVATFHVTGPPSYLPRPELREAVEVALGVGARVVAAHGTHAVAPVERRDGSVIAWGLGNLLFSCDCTEEIDGAILRASIGQERVDAQIIPIDAGLRGGAARPSHDPALLFDLFEAIGSSPLERNGTAARF